MTAKLKNNVNIQRRLYEAVNIPDVVNYRLSPGCFSLPLLPPLRLNHTVFCRLWILVGYFWAQRPSLSPTLLREGRARTHVFEAAVISCVPLDEVRRG